MSAASASSSESLNAGEDRAAAIALKAAEARMQKHQRVHRKIRKRKLKNIESMTRLAFRCMVTFFVTLVILSLGTASTWTSTPLGYHVVVGFGYRSIEVVYVCVVSWLMKVDDTSKTAKSRARKRKKRRRKKNKKGMKSGKPKAQRERKRAPHTDDPLDTTSMADSVRDRNSQASDMLGEGWIAEMEVDMLSQSSESADPAAVAIEMADCNPEQRDESVTKMSK